MVEYSGDRDEFRDRVRGTLGDISEEFISDDNIDEQLKTKAIPFIGDKIKPEKHEQTDIDNALVVYSAYRAFSSIPLMSTISGGGLTANLSPAQYRSELRQDTSIALSKIGVQLPDENGGTPFVKRTDGMLRDD